MTGVLCIAVGGQAPVSLGVSASNILKISPVGEVASGSSTASVSGGSGSYTYAWTPTGAGINYSGTTTATLTASCPNTAEGSVSGSASLLVTDTVTG